MAVSAYVISAICGCFKRESGVNPGVWENLTIPSDTYYHIYQYDNIGGYGFGQFTNVRNPYTGEVSWRCRDYYEWCVANNYQPDDGSAQMNYIVNVERVWMDSSQKRGSYNTIQEFLASDSTNLEDLTWDWLACWEGVPGDAFAERYAFAQLALSYIQSHQNDDPHSYSWVTGNFYSTEAQMLNNVMCMYFYFDGYTPSTHSGDLRGFINWCIEKCNAQNVGYSTQYREEQTVNGITYYDCSSFIWYGLAHNGFDINATGHPSYAFNTTAMPEDLVLMGWVEVDRNGELKQGDIGVSSTHAEVVYQGGNGEAIFMGAHSASYPLDEQVSISDFVSQGTRFEHIYRFNGGSPGPGPGPTPIGHRKLPLWMMLRRLPF